MIPASFIIFVHYHIPAYFILLSILFPPPPGNPARLDEEMFSLPNFYMSYHSSSSLAMTSRALRATLVQIICLLCQASAPDEIYSQVPKSQHTLHITLFPAFLTFNTSFIIHISFAYSSFPLLHSCSHNTITLNAHFTSASFCHINIRSPF